MVLYNDAGVPITTHSMIKQMRRCPKAMQYKYSERLKPRSIGRPLQFGKWMHWLLEAHYKGEDWKQVHRELSEKYSQLFDEEKEKIGDLPNDCYNLMLSYLWHYRDEKWIVHEVEFLVETEFPDGGIYRGKVDMLIEDDYGLWIVDHKNHKALPDSTFRLLDAQSALYVWAARRMGIPVAGFIWNYLKTAPPSKPKMIASEKRLSKVMGDSTYVTYAREIKKIGKGLDWDPTIRPTLERLKNDRYEYGKTQTSPFFLRSTLERDDGMIKKVAAEAFRTHRRIHSYPFTQRDAVERVPDRSCTYMCSYTRLCQTELFGGLADNIRRQDFREADPQAYYNDERNLGD